MVSVDEIPPKMLFAAGASKLNGVDASSLLSSELNVNGAPEFLQTKRIQLVFQSNVKNDKLACCNLGRQIEIIGRCHFRGIIIFRLGCEFGANFFKFGKTFLYICVRIGCILNG